MWRKHYIFPPKTRWIATNHFVQSLSFDHQHNFFFPSWNIDFIIPLVSITYLALIHNYNTIKYICFISLRQRAGMHLVILRKYKSCDFSYFIHYYYLLSYILRCTVIVWFFIIFNLVFNFLFCTIKLFWAKICWESWIKK
jgi:hypothetical protein